jgi:hypothetical protein
MIKLLPIDYENEEVYARIFLKFEAFEIFFIEPNNSLAVLSYE